jgi:hypothetical protein
VGLYVDKAATKRALSSFKGATSASALSDPAFAQTIIDAHFVRTVSVKMVRTVGSQVLVDSVAESVKPRMKGKNPEALSSFVKVLLDGIGGSKVRE